VGGTVLAQSDLMKPTLTLNWRVLLLGILLTPFAVCDPLQLTFSGIGSGSLGNDTFSDTPFTFVFSSDTSLLTTPPCCSNDTSTPQGTPAEFTITGIGSGALTGNQAVFVNPSENDVGIWVYTSPDFLTLGNFAFASYALSTDIGPISGTPSALAEFLPTSIGNELLSLNSVSDLSFTAVAQEQVAPVPEPSTLTMVGLAFGCLAVGAKLRRNPGA